MSGERQYERRITKEDKETLGDEGYIHYMITGIIQWVHTYVKIYMCLLNICD